MGIGHGAGKGTMAGDKETPTEGEEGNRMHVTRVQKRANGKGSGQQELAKDGEGRREAGPARAKLE